jgi:hypothetical protein
MMIGMGMPMNQSNKERMMCPEYVRTGNAHCDPTFRERVRRRLIKPSINSPAVHQMMRG